MDFGAAFERANNEPKVEPSSRAVSSQSITSLELKHDQELDKDEDSDLSSRLNKSLVGSSFI